RPLLFKYLKMLYISSIEFEDFKQEGELALLEIIRRYDPEKGDLPGYIKKALYYSLVRIREKLLNKELSLEEIPEVSLKIFEEWEKKDIDFSKLSPREKQVIVLAYYSKYSERRIASYLGISRGSVKVYKKRAINKLKLM
ncbi:MAG: sigma-70 family RNA polymerase sigma factor, partial [Dictyoglomus sp.]